MTAVPQLPGVIAATSARAADHRRTRLHEGGHALARHLAGGRDELVLVHDEPDRKGRTQGWMPTEREAIGMTAAEWRSFLETEAIVSLAGAAALAVAGDADPHQGGEPDRDTAHAIAEWLNPQAPRAEVERLYAVALEQMRAHLPELDRFVDILEANNDRLAGEELAIAWRAVDGKWPSTPRFDRESRSLVMRRHRALFEAAAAPTDAPETLAAKWAAAEEQAWSGAPTPTDAAVFVAETGQWVSYDPGRESAGEAYTRVRAEAGLPAAGITPKRGRQT